MSSAGHVFDSIARMKQNRDQLLARREKIARLKSSYIDSIKIEGYEFHEDHIPKEVVEKVKERIRHDIKRNRIRSTVASLTLASLFIALIIFLAVKYIKY